MTELKPCPFCGGQAVVQHIFDFGEYSQAKCTRCGAKTEKILKSFAYSSDEKAIEAWNRRYNDEKA